MSLRKLLSDTDFDSNFKSMSYSYSSFPTTLFISVAVCVIVFITVLVIICCWRCRRRGYTGTVFRQPPQQATVVTTATTQYQAPSAPPYMGAPQAPYYPNQPTYPQPAYPQPAYPQPGYQQQGAYYPAQCQPLMATGYPQQQVPQPYKGDMDAPPPYAEVAMQKASAPPPE